MHFDNVKFDNISIVPPPTVPGVPIIGKATATGTTTVSVSFTQPVSNGGATITSYTVTSSPGGLTGTEQLVQLLCQV